MSGGTSSSLVTLTFVALLAIPTVDAKGPPAHAGGGNGANAFDFQHDGGFLAELDSSLDGRRIDPIQIPVDLAKSKGFTVQVLNGQLPPMLYADETEDAVEIRGTLRGGEDLSDRYTFTLKLQSWSPPRARQETFWIDIDLPENPDQSPSPVEDEPISGGDNPRPYSPHLVSECNLMTAEMVTQLNSAIRSTRRTKDEWCASTELVAQAFPEATGNLQALKTLRLQGKHLSRIPMEIGGLTALEDLHIQKTAIEQLPEEVGYLTNMQRLSVRWSHLKALPESIGDLTQLRSLTISKTWALTTLPDGIEDLANLRELDLSDNRITELPASIGRLDQLRTLDLTRNPIASLPAEVANMDNLETLLIGYTGIRDLPEAVCAMRDTGTRIWWVVEPGTEAKHPCQTN